MISAQEAQAAGPIAEYIAVSRALQNHIWQAVYQKQNYTHLSNAYAIARVGYDNSTAWHNRLVDELRALGYEVSAEGVVSW